MARPLRIEFEGALCHVTSRCDRRKGIYEDDAVPGDTNCSVSARQEHIWVDDDHKDEVFYVHSDHLNTPRALTAKEGILRWRWAFQGNAFGELAPDPDPEPTGSPVDYRLRFPGQYFDAAENQGQPRSALSV